MAAWNAQGTAGVGGQHGNDSLFQLLGRVAGSGYDAALLSTMQMWERAVSLQVLSHASVDDLEGLNEDGVPVDRDGRGLSAQRLRTDAEVQRDEAARPPSQAAAAARDQAALDQIFAQTADDTISASDED
jgi:hypothetical protein